MAKLKIIPCPFCGGQRAQIMNRWADIGDRRGGLIVYVRCTRKACGAAGPFSVRYTEHSYEVEEKAIRYWNRRVTE